MSYDTAYTIPLFYEDFRPNSPFYYIFSTRAIYPTIYLSWTSSKSTVVHSFLFSFSSQLIGLSTILFSTI